MRIVLKAVARLVALAVMSPFALLTAFGRWTAMFSFFAQACALFPGVLGDYLRSSYYAMTLRSCSLRSRISFGTFFAHPNSAVAASVNIGAYCIIGRALIGERTFIGGSVQILSGSQQHRRNAEGRFVEGEFVQVKIGSDCWIGASSVIMADVGSGATVAAGAVVSSPVLAGSVVAGNPARLVRKPAEEISKT